MVVEGLGSWTFMEVLPAGGPANTAGPRSALLGRVEDDPVRALVVILIGGA
jgi:hypothetical protein